MALLRGSIYHKLKFPHKGMEALIFKAIGCMAYLLTYANTYLPRPGTAEPNELSADL